MRFTSLARYRASSVRRPGSFQPRLYLLEDRTLLSVLVVDRLTDTGAGAGLAGDFRYCLMHAVDGDTITFDVQGTINLTGALPDISHSVDIEGPGADLVTIRRDTGGDYRILTVRAGTTVGISGLTLANGKAIDGGGIYVDRAALTLADSVLTGNVATGIDGAGVAGQGGGLYMAGGSLAISGSMITNNQSTGGRGGNGYGYFSNCFYVDGGAGGQGQGGGLYAVGGALSISESTLANNQVTGGDGGNGISCRTGAGGSTRDGTGGPGGASQGAGLYASGGLVTVTDSMISNDSGRGGVGGVGPGNVAGGGASQGGGLYVSGTLNITNSTIITNVLRGGDRGGASQGGGLYVSGTLNIRHSRIAANALRGGDDYSLAGAGASQGGGLYASGTLTITDSAIATNTLHGGNGFNGFQSFGGVGGASQGAGLYVSGTLTVTNSTVSANSACGGNGGNGWSSLGSGYAGGPGGVAQGGGLYDAGAQVSISNTTIAANSVRGGDGGSGGVGGVGYRGGNGGNGGVSQGGGIFTNVGSFELMDITVADNVADASLGGAGGAGSPPGIPGADQPGQGAGARRSGGTVEARNSLFADNTADTEPDFSGDFAHANNDLLGDGSGSNLIDGTNGNLVGSPDNPIDPMLGPLEDNGGPTQTMALLPGSPAIGAGDKTGHPRWDQRGRPYRRVVNHRMDIGAFEVQSDRPGPSAPGNGRSAGPIRVPRISALPLPTEACALGSVAPFPGSEATLSLNRDVVSKQEGESDPQAAAVDQLFTSLGQQAQRPRPVWWPNLEPIQFGGLYPDFFSEKIELVL